MGISDSADVDFMPSAAVTFFRATWDYIPMSILSLFYLIPVNPFTRIRYLRTVFTEYGKEILREQRAEIDVEKTSQSKDVMSLLSKLTCSPTLSPALTEIICAVKANSSADPKTRLSDAELMAEMFTLTLAGHETTSSSLTFLTYELARHPEYQQRMRKEIQERRALIISRGDTDFTLEDLDSLTLTMNAIKVHIFLYEYRLRLTALPALQETLRYHNIASYLPRIAVKDDVIPLAYPITSTTGETITEIPVRAGQVVFTSFATYHRCV